MWTLTWLPAIAYAAIAIALGILGLGAVNNTVAKVTLVIAAIAWAVFAFAALGIGLPLTLGTIAIFVAAIAGVVGAVVVLVGREVANTPALVFVIAMVLGALSCSALATCRPGRSTRGSACSSASRSSSLECCSGRRSVAGR